MKKLLLPFPLLAAALLGAPTTPVNNGILTGQTVFIGAIQSNYTSMPALDVNFTKYGNSYSAAGDVPFTYNGGTPPVAWTTTYLRITADASDRTISIPSTWSLARGGNITSILVPATTTGQYRLQYTGSRYEIAGDPPNTTGSGAYVLATGATLVAPYIGSATGSVLTLGTFDPADAGVIRLENSAVIGWEASPAGTDVTLTVNASEQFVFSNTIIAPTLILGTTDPADTGVVRLENGAVIAWESSPTGSDVTFTVNSAEQFVFSNDILSPSLAGTPTAPTATVGTNTTQIATTAFVLANAGSATFGNPTASVGLTAVNGAATSAMRSDAAPPIDQSIAPSWTGSHTFVRNGIGVTPTPVLILSNSTAAANGAQQKSPAIQLTGAGWKSSGGTSQVDDWLIENLPVQGSTNSTSSLNFRAQIAGGGFNTSMSINSDGTLTGLNGLSVTGTGSASIGVGASGSLAFNGRSRIVSGADGSISFLNNASTATAAIIGTVTNDSAISGGVGETVSSAVASGSAVSLTTATGANVTSVSLTAGDWDVSGNVNVTYTTATTTASSAGISTTTATVPTDGTECYSGVRFAAGSGLDTITMPTKRVSIASTTTVYLVVNQTFTGTSASAFGSITARRRR